ncbi:MAG: polysaccharide biosynthesis tyrosine autokinase [Pseudolabrys sp.]|jgi:exopolysaccharide transport family protein
MSQRATEYVPTPLSYEPEHTAGSPGWEGVTLSEIFRILRRRIALIAVTTLIFAAAAIIAVMIIRPLYTATTTVLIDPRRPNVINLDAKQTQVQAPATDDAAIESQVLLVQSVAVLRRVVDELKLADDPDFKPKPGLLAPVKRLFAEPTATNVDPQEAARMGAVSVLQGRLKVARQRNSFLIDVNVSAHDSRTAARVSNAIAQAYFNELVRSKSDATKMAAGWLNQQLNELKARVLGSDKAVEEFRGAHNLTLSQGETVNSQQITDLNSKLVEARAEAAQARAKFDQVAEIAKSKADPGSLSEALSSETIARLRGQYAQLTMNEADLASRYGPQHPQVTAVKAQLRDTQKLIGAEVQRILQSRRHSYEVAAAREASLEKSLAALQNISTESGQAEVRLRELQREADANRALYESFLSRYKEANARESLDLPEARLVTAANAPMQPAFPKAWLFLGLAIPLGAAFGSIVAIAVDRFDRRVKTIDQVESISGVPGIASLPLVGLRELSRITKRGRDELARYREHPTRMLPLALQPPLMRYIIEEPNSVFAEAIRAVRLSVQRTARTRPMQTIMMTSAIDGEGKTTLAANLALSYAMMGVRTLIVEGDLRNPQLTRSLCPNAEWGLFDVALGRASLQQTVLFDNATSLSVLPSPSSDELEAMSEFAFSDSMRIILGELRRHYEVIIVDAPPLIPLVDSRALGEHVDGIVLAVGWDRTPQDLIARAIDLLSPLRERVLGTVLTRVDLRRLRNYDYYHSSAYIKPYAYSADLRPSANS